MSTENQRLTDSIKYLKSNRLISNDKDFIEQIGIDRNRLSYLKQENGGRILAEEIQILENKFPQINWSWVKFGEGSMLNTTDESINLVEESTMIYQKNPDHGKMINEIVSGLSTLPEHEQKRILIKEVLHLQQKVINVYESTNPLKIWDDIKKLIK